MVPALRGLPVLMVHPDPLAVPPDLREVPAHPETQVFPGRPEIQAPPDLRAEQVHPAIPVHPDLPASFMRKFYHIAPKTLTSAQCAELVKYAQTHPAQEATVGHGGGGSIVNNDLRKSTIRWLKRSDMALSALYALIEAETHRANADWFGRDIRSFNDVQFTEYPSECKAGYGWHTDSNAVPSEKDYKPFDRQLSVCIQLSERNSYEGGEFWMDNHGQKEIKDFREIGDMIIFPSQFWHKVMPVTVGQRNSLVLWWVGPR